MSAATPSAGPAPKPRRRPRVEMEVFGSFTPWKNPAAVYSYAASLAALTPVVGLALGPVAVALGLVGLVHRRLRPKVHGTNFAVAGIALGLLTTALNAAGVWCVGRGLGWW